MKSAYELAMERLEQKDSSRKLTDAQKQEINELNNLYRSKKAERETFLTSKIQEALATGNMAEADQFRNQLAHDLRNLEEELEAKKRKIWGD
ncbi:MAG: hypothetical protein OHK005_11240 [Candidatus Methylacidiphilales bacterium]